MNVLTDLELTAAIVLRQGTECLVPGCSDPWTDRSHVEPSGMGGRPSLRNPENLVGLCRHHHDVFDGRELHGRQHMLRILMKHLADSVAVARKSA